MAKGDFVLVDEGYSEFDETSRDTEDSVLGGSNEEERFWGITSSKSSVQITVVRHRSPPAAVVLAGLHRNSSKNRSCRHAFDCLLRLVWNTTLYCDCVLP